MYRPWAVDMIRSGYLRVSARQAAEEESANFSYEEHSIQTLENDETAVSN